MNISTIELGSFVDSLLDFLKSFDPSNKGVQIPLPKIKNENGTTKSKDNLFIITIKISLSIEIEKVDNFFHIENNKSHIFSVNILELRSSQLTKTEIVNPNHREIHHFYKN